MVSNNFQAVVLAAGRGSRFPDLTGNKPKCLLPVGPYPLIWYPLQMLQDHGFLDTIVVVLETQKTEIQQAIERCPLKIKIEYVSLPSDSDMGTADSLIQIRDKIKSDVLLVSCDVITNTNLYPLFNTFRQHDASVAALLFHGVNTSDVTIPGPKTKHKPDRDLIGLHPENQRLLFLASTSDFEDSIKFSSQLLKKSGKIAFHSNLLDSHIYALKKWVIDYLCNSPGFSTVKGELLPFIVKKQMSRPSRSVEQDKPISEVNVNVKHNDIFLTVDPSDIEKKITETSFFNDSRSKNAYNSDIIRCYGVTAQKESFGIRVNTMMGFCAANKKIYSLLEKLQPEIKTFISPTSTINSTQIVNSSVSDNTVISEKTSIKTSVFGTNCKINEKVRISDTIIMNNVIIEAGAVIESCIICDKAVVSAGCVLKFCLIGSNFVVPVNTKKEKAHLSTSDGFMEIE